MPYKDPEAHRASMRRWYAKNAAKQKAAANAWRAKNAEVKRATDQRYGAENRTRLSARKLEWNRRNPERHRETNRKWADNHREELREIGRRSDFWRSADEHRIAYVSAWRERNPDKIIAYRAKARAAISEADWNRILAIVADVAEGD